MADEEERARAANIFDVARLAGVSHQTVSRVINDHPNVRASTRDRVNKAIKQLRYRPNIAARAMVTRRSRNLGLITTGAPEFGPSSTVLGFSAAAREARYNVSIATLLENDPTTMTESIELLLTQSIEAIVVIASRQGIIDALNAVQVDRPIVMMQSSGNPTARSVSIDQYEGARLATEHLIQQGHRHILHLAGPEDSTDAIERVRGWRATMAQHGLVAPTPERGDWSSDSGYAFGTRLSQSRSRYTAVFAANDQMALGCVHAYRDQGLRVPDDLSIIGFDDIPDAAHYLPPLTSMRQDFRQLGRDILTAVLDELDDRVSSRPRLIPELVVRDSVGRVPVTPELLTRGRP